MTFFSLYFILALVIPGFSLIHKRDAPLQTLVVPVTVDENQVYSVQVNMSSATPQKFSFALSTGTGYSMVAGRGCQSCNGVPSYDQSASSSAHTTPGAAKGQISIVGGLANGTLIKEDCTLHEKNGSAWAYPNQTIIVANQSQSIFGPGISGIFGLGTNARDGNFADTVYAGFLRRNPTRTNFTFGMALNRRKDSSSDGGVLHWVLPDQTAYTGDVAWKNMNPFNSTPSSVSSDWFIEMDGYAFTSSNGPSISKSGLPLQTVLDPFFPNIVFPQTETRSIYGSIPGSSIVSSTDVTNVYSVPCSTTMTLNLTFGSITTTLTENDLIQNQNDQCFSVMEEWSNINDPSYLLGSSLISTIYLIFAITSDTNAALGVAQRSQAAARSFKTAAIVGLTLGLVASVILLGLGIFFGIRWYRRRRANLVQQIQPFQTNTREATGLLTASSPDWLQSHSGLPSAAMSDPSTCYPSTQQSHILLDSSSNDPDSPPPYLTQWPRPFPVVPLSSPPDRKRRYGSDGTTG
ncbi:aspartic peptidase domain-containing protein [Mycena floridula]|nr:aspartic peptidase domain-containing protein [Mycena floridula]